MASLETWCQLERQLVQCRGFSSQDLRRTQPICSPSAPRLNASWQKTCCCGSRTSSLGSSSAVTREDPRMTGWQGTVAASRMGHHQSELARRSSKLVMVKQSHKKVHASNHIAQSASLKCQASQTHTRQREGPPTPTSAARLSCRWLGVITFWYVGMPATQAAHTL